MFSIDQNCHSLWDVVPKLQALSARGIKTRHFIEDVDVAFTSAGADLEGAQLHLVREQFHRGGVADWGAALFYSEFLGRLPIDIRQWEPYTGITTAAAARKLHRSVDELYNEFSPSDNWQLVGPSYVTDREHHRTIGDLTVTETAPLLRELLVKARTNCMATFPQPEPQRRIATWFDREEETIRQLLDSCAQDKLVDLYRVWLGKYLDENTALGMSSVLFGCGANPTMTALLEVFLRDYDLAAGLYNEAVTETAVGLHPLRTSRGELPFYATLTHEEHLVRTGAYLLGEDLRIGQRSFALERDRRLPLGQLKTARIRCLVGKAVVLVLQVRMEPDGGGLALPYHGSQYVPASARLAEKLRTAGLLSGELRPVVRVRFRLLDRLSELDTIIRLPEHLRSSFGRDEVPAREVAQNYPAIAKDSLQRLESLKDENARIRWGRENLPEIAREIAELEARRRELARVDPKSLAIRDLGKRQKDLQLKLFRALLDQISRDAQVSQIDYWDSRGALLPWCIALGGEEMYNRLISQAEIYPEATDGTL
jgi:hypothetical protein